MCVNIGIAFLREGRDEFITAPTEEGDVKPRMNEKMREEIIKLENTHYMHTHTYKRNLCSFLFLCENTLTYEWVSVNDYKEPQSQARHPNNSPSSSMHNTHLPPNQTVLPPQPKAPVPLNTHHPEGIISSDPFCFATHLRRHSVILMICIEVLIFVDENPWVNVFHYQLDTNMPRYYERDNCHLRVPVVFRQALLQDYVDMIWNWDRTCLECWPSVPNLLANVDTDRRGSRAGQFSAMGSTEDDSREERWRRRCSPLMKMRRRCCCHWVKIDGCKPSSDSWNEEWQTRRQLQVKDAEAREVRCCSSPKRQQSAAY